MLLTGGQILRCQKNQSYADKTKNEPAVTHKRHDETGQRGPRDAPRAPDNAENRIDDNEFLPGKTFSRANKRKRIDRAGNGPQDIGWTLQDVIARCRDYVVSPYLVHFFRSTSQAKRGDAVSSRTLTMRFSAARDKTGIAWENGTPPTFHEQRSLAERIYRKQGNVDTRRLLGHKSQHQTDVYNDNRGKDWLTITVSGG